jgi:hypothetical protein
MLPWIFPDHAYQMNHRGTIPEPVLRPFNGVLGSESPFAAHDRQVAMDRVHNTQRAKLGMEGRLNVTARSQRKDLPASRSAVPNGVFEGSPMEYVTSGGLRGGVITTKEGQEWLQKRLKERIEEYGALSSGGPAKPYTPIATSPYLELDTTFSSLFTSLGAGSYTSATADSANKLLLAFLKVGSVITPSQLADYSRNLGKLIESIRPYIGDTQGQTRGFTFTPNEERLRLIDQIYKTFQLCDQVVKEIARTIYDSQSSRDQVMSSLSARLLGSQAAAYNPVVSGPERQMAVQAAQPVQMGRTFRGEPAQEFQGQFERVPPRVVPFGLEEGAPAAPSMWDAAVAEEGPPAVPVLRGAPPRLENVENSNSALGREFNQPFETGTVSGLGKKRRGRPRKY